MDKTLAMVVYNMQNTARVGGLHIDQRKDALTAIVARLYSLRGQGGDPAALAAPLALAVSELEKEVAVKYPFMTLAEIRYALEEGVKGTWETEQTRFQGGSGLNVANYCRWLRAYRDSAVRLEAAQAIQNGQRVTDPSRLIAPEDIARKNAEYQARTLDLFKQEIHDAGVIDASHLDGRVANTYDDLRKSGAMPLPGKDVIEAAMSRAAAVMRSAEKCAVILRAKRYILQDWLRAMDPAAPAPRTAAAPAGPLAGVLAKAVSNINAA